MKLEDQVCSLELAKRLKELGVKQESYFYWWVCEDKSCNHDPMYSVPELQTCEPTNLSGYSAFTIAEFGEMLPEVVILNKVKFHLLYFKYKNECRYVNLQCKSGKMLWNDGIPSIMEIPLKDTEANARAKMLIYLIENKLLSGTL